VRGLLPLVDHPEGLDGVYGADVIEEARDPLFAPLFVSDIMGRLPASGAWIYVQDSTRHRVGLTPVVNPDTISDAFKLAKGMPVQLTGSDNEDPYLHKKAPDFRTQMLNGKFFELDALKGQKIILTFYTNSQESKDISKLIAEAQKRPEFSGVLFYSLLMMSRAEAMKFFKQTGQQSEILLESPAGIAGLYSSRDRPRVFYIGRDENVDYYSMLGDEPALIARNLTKAVGG
jgi:hypothetical protein